MTMSVRRMPEDLPQGGCTCLRLRRTARRATQIYDRHLQPLDLRITQYSLLGHLSALPPTPIGAFAETMAMDRTTLTRNIKPLQKAGLVELVPGEDRRSKGLAITAAGRQLLRRAYPAWRAAELEVRAAIGEDATGDLHRMLDDSLRKLAAA